MYNIVAVFLHLVQAQLLPTAGFELKKKQNRPLHRVSNLKQNPAENPDVFFVRRRWVRVFFSARFVFYFGQVLGDDMGHSKRIEDW